MKHDHDPSYVLAAGIVMPVLGIIFVTLRFYTRSKQKAGYGADDWLSLFALFMVLGSGICLIVGVKLKVLGYPTPPAGLLGNPTYMTSTVPKIEYAFFMMQPLGLGSIKLSFVFFYRRIFVSGNPRSAFSIATFVVIGIIAAWTISYFFTFIFVCGTHPSVFWESTKASSAHCFKTSKNLQGYAISDFLTDFFVILLPVPVVLRLHMTTGRKMAVLSVFGLGAVAVVASVLRLYIFITASRGDRKAGTDLDVIVTRGLYWSVLEIGLALIACCLPSLRSLLASSLQSVIDSVRSVTSLRSFRSGGSNNSRTFHGQIPKRIGSTSSSIAMVRDHPGPHANIVEAYALEDGVKMSQDDHDAARGGIWVNKSVSQNSSAV